MTVLADLTDPDDCHLIHNGDCVAHTWTDEGECPHARAKRLLAGQAGPLTAAEWSRTLFDARESLSMWADILTTRTGSPHAAATVRRTITAIDAYRGAQGWHPHGFGNEPGTPEPPSALATAVLDRIRGLSDSIAMRAHVDQVAEEFGLTL